MNVPRLHPAAAPAAVVVAAAALRVAVFQGFAASDDLVYHGLARAFAEGGVTAVRATTATPVFQGRLGVLVPTAAAPAVWPAEIACAALPFVSSLVLVLAAYALAHVAFGRGAALTAALVAAVHPLMTVGAGTLAADLPQAAWLAAAAWWLLRPGAAGAARGLAAGVCLGAAWLTKESAVFAFPLLLLRAALERRRPGVLVESAAVFAAFGAVFAAEALMYAIVTGDALQRFTDMRRTYDASARWFFAEGSPFGWAPGGYAAALAKRLVLTGPRDALLAERFGGTALAALGAIVWAVRTGDRRFAGPALHFAGWTALFMWGSSSPTTYKPLVLLDRYLAPAFVPACVLVGGFVAAVAAAGPAARPEEARARETLAGMLLAAVLVACALPLVRAAAAGPASAAEHAAARLVPAGALLHTDERTAWTLAAVSPATAVRPFDGHDGPPASGAFVLVHRPRLDFLFSEYGRPSPAFARDPPPAWREVWRGRDVVLYAVP